MKAKMMKQNISEWMIPPGQMNSIPSFWWLSINVLIEHLWTQSVSSEKLSCWIPQLRCLLFAGRPVLLFLALPGTIGLQSSSSLWSSDALRNLRETHLQRLTFGLGSARLGLNTSLRANPGEQEIISFWSAWSSEVHSGQTWRPGDNWMLPSHTLPTGLASLWSQVVSRNSSGTKEVCPDNRAVSEETLSLHFPPSPPGLGVVCQTGAGGSSALAECSQEYRCLLCLHAVSVHKPRGCLSWERALEKTQQMWSSVGRSNSLPDS